MYSQVPFDISATELPANFRGHDVQTLYDELSKRRRYSKSEYETTEQFKQRAAAVGSAPLVGSITSKALLAFVVPEPDVLYDADKGVINMNVEYSAFKPESDAKGYSAVIKTKSFNRSYVGSNAYGATASVSQTFGFSYELFWDNTDEKVMKKSGIGTAVQMDVETARRIKPSLAALMICTLKPIQSACRYLKDCERLTFSSGTVSERPTFNRPYDQVRVRGLLNATLLAVWYFDSTSGKVYAKIQPPVKVGR